MTFPTSFRSCRIRATCRLQACLWKGRYLSSLDGLESETRGKFLKFPDESICCAYLHVSQYTYIFLLSLVTKIIIINQCSGKDQDAFFDEVQ